MTAHDSGQRFSGLLRPYLVQLLQIEWFLRKVLLFRWKNTEQLPCGQCGYFPSQHDRVACQFLRLLHHIQGDVLYRKLRPDEGRSLM